MNGTARGDPDTRMQGAIGTLLRTGVLLAAAIVGVGLVAWLAASAGMSAQFGTFRGALGLNRVNEIVGHAFHLQSAAIIQLGLVVLILTPVARVALSAVAFALERDWLYVALTVVVLVILLFGLTGRVI